MGSPSRHVPSSAITGFIQHGRLEALLAPWVPDARDREFIVRCMLDEGPAHHRGTNWVLLSLLGQLLERLPGPPPAPGDVPVPVRVAPHLLQPGGAGGEAYPLRLPTRALARLARPGTRDLDAMVDCLTDGPAQHALANAAMVALLEALLDRLPQAP
jgi:hypothetical protein